MDTPEPTSAGDLPAQSRRAARKMRDQRLSARLAVWLVAPLATLLVALILVFFVFFESSTVSGPSMVPTLRNADYVLATKGLPDPKPGDIVILNMVNNKTGAPEEWVKRVVAVGGDTVDVFGDTIVVNGKATDYGQWISSATLPIGHSVVEADRIFVAGDNRGLSEDSRYRDVGTIPVTSVKGRVIFIYAPIWRFGPVAAPGR